MSTGAEFVNIVAKRLFSYEDYSERFLSFLMESDRDIASNIFAEDCIFEEEITFAGTADSVITLSQSSDYKCTDGIGNFLSLAEDSSEDATIGQIKVIPIENTISTDYHVSLQYVEIPQGIEANPRNGVQQYQQIVQGIGYKAAPNSVVDNGGSLTLTIDSVCESGHSHAGRTALVYMVTPDRSATTEAVAIESCTVTWNGSNNRVTTADVFGQNSPSTTASDYLVILLGPTVRKADISGTSGHVYLGVVEGVGAGLTPGSGDVSSQKIVDYSFESMLDWPAGPDWKDGTTNPATTLSLQITKIVTDLAALTGAPKIGATAQTSGGVSVSDGSVATQIGELLVYIDASSLKSVYVLDATGAVAADYSGADALIDALADLTSDVTLYLRSGTYNFAGLSSSNDSLRIIGESKEDTFLANIIDISLGGANVTFENLTFDTTGNFGESLFTVGGEYQSYINCIFLGDSATDKIRVTWDYALFDNCVFTETGFFVSGDNCTIRHCYMLKDQGGPLMDIDSASYLNVVNCYLKSNEDDTYTGIHIQDGSSHIKFLNCAIIIWGATSYSKRGILLEKCTKVYFDNCLMSITAGACIKYGEYTPTNSVEANFTNCRIEGTVVCDSSLSDGVISPGGRLPQSAKLKFINTYIYGGVTGGGSGYYRAPFIQLLSDLESVRQITMMNCELVDAKCQGHDGDAPPATGSSTEFPVVEFLGVNATNIKFDRTGIDYDIQDSPWLRLTDSNVDGFYLRYACDVAGGAYNYESASDGLIEVLDNSSLKNLVIDGPLGKGCDATNGWYRPAVYVKGLSPSGITEDRTGGIAIVDRVEFKQTTTDEWYAQTAVPLLVQLDGAAILRRLTFGERNVLALSSGHNKITQYLIEARGEYDIVEDCLISLADGSTYGGLLQYVIYISNVGRNTIRNNRIIVDDPTAATFGLATVIYCTSDHNLISENFIQNVTGNLGASGAIYLTSTAQLCRVLANEIYTATCTASQNLIYTGAAAYGGVNAGCCVVSDNIVFSAGGGNTPAIGSGGGAQVGLADNAIGGL
jgi:hypothetical protein